MLYSKEQIEQWGSGIPRLLADCKRVGLKEPELLEIGGSFRVNMFRNTEMVSNTTQATQTTTQDVTLSDLDQEVLKVLIKNPRLTQKEIALELGWKIDRVKYYINKLKQQNIIERIGSSQKGYWNLLIDKGMV